MRKINGVINPKRVHPNATGFQRDLYRTEGVSPAEQQHLEKKFFAPIDTQASLALERILSRDRSPWAEELRSAWTRYLLSLIFRVPSTIALVKKHVSDLWEIGVNDLRDDYAGRKGETDPDTFDEYMAQTHAAAPHIAATNLVTQLIDNENLGPTIFKMHWSSVDLSRSKQALLFSDRPLDRPYGLSHPEAYIAIPVSPTMLFVAANNPKLGDAVGGDNPTKIVKLMNKTVVSKASEYVWGKDDSQLNFVRKYMGTSPEPDVITDEQRAAAIAASRPIKQES